MFTYFGTLIHWIGHNSLKASLLITLILLTKFILKNRLPARWHYFLWFLLIVRLILPWAPQSTLSAYNLTKMLTPKTQTVQSLNALPQNNISENGATPVSKTTLVTQPQDGADLSLNNITTLNTGKSNPNNLFDLLGIPSISNNLLIRIYDLPVSIINTLFFLWAIVAVILGIYTLFANWNFRKRLKTTPVTNEYIIKIFDKAKTTSNVKSFIPLLMTTQIKTPSLHGIFQMTLLLPEDILEKIDSEQLYYVFLHELVHYKRKDLWVNGVMNLLVIIHWFNPLIWYGYSKMRQDQELACDESTLSLLGPSLTNAYGLTLIKFLSISSNTPRFAHLTEISSTKSQIRRRLERIKNFRPLSWKLGIVLFIIVLAVVTSTLTDAKTKNEAKPIEAAQTVAVVPTIGTLTLAATDIMQTGTYTGEIVGGKANGHGKITFENADDWVGMFKDNKWIGNGIITYRREGQPDNVKDFDVDKIVKFVDTRNADGLYPDPVGAPGQPYDINGDKEPIHPDNPNYYMVWTKRPAGIVIHRITFHEGFRAPGMKAVDVHIFARSHNKENELIQGRDEIISITGSTGKVYNMIGTKRTGVNTNAHYVSFQEQEITEYQDISVNEKTITSIVVRRDGKLITIKPDKETKVMTTHA